MRNLTEADRHALAEHAGRAAKSFTDIGCRNGEMTAAQHQTIQRYFEQILRQYRAVGAVMVLAGPQTETVFCFGTATRHPAVPVNQETCFRVASVTKLVSTFGILSLVERGLLALDTDVSEYLGFSLRNPSYSEQPITLRMLLTHTASIRNAPLDQERFKTPEERLADNGIWDDYAPGMRFQYSNLGAGIVGVIAERAWQGSFNEMMRETVLDPLQICAGYGASLMPEGHIIADGFSVRSIFPPMRKYDAAAQRKTAVRAAIGEDYAITVGRLILDAHGMAQCIRLLGSQTDTAVLRRESLEEMRSNQTGRGDIVSAERGLNVAFLNGVIPGCSLIGHQGVAYGMCSELFSDPEHQTGVGIMINGALLDHGVVQRVGLELLTLGFAALNG